MGLFNKIFGNRHKASDGIEDYFQTLTAYTPAFTTFEGGLYEMELTRAAIHSFANFCSKLKAEIHGTAYKNLERILQFQPNPFMDASRFLYRIATILSVNNNAFITPIEDELGNITGYYPILPADVEVLERNGAAYLRYTFATGERAAIEYEKVGVMTQFQFKDDFFGSDNSSVKHTLQLINIQNQGIINAVKNSADIRFLAKIAGAQDPVEIKEARDNFSKESFTSRNKSGLLVHDSTFAELKQIESKPYTVNAAQMKLINENVYNYFGTNETILQNRFSEDEWNAYYEGKIVPFALQLSLVLTNMTYTEREKAHGNKITLTTNRLQYMSHNTKLEHATQLSDRGILSVNEAREILGYPPVEGGDERMIRREYVPTDLLGMADLEVKHNLGIATYRIAGGEDDADNAEPTDDTKD